MNRTTLAIAAPLAALVLAAAPASAATHPKVLDIGHCSASGQDAMCITGGGQISRPAHIWLNVHASPDQRVDVYWDDSCMKGNSESSNDGSFTLRTPIKSRLLPLPGRRMSSCWMTANVSLHAIGAKGSITAWVTATKR